MNTPIITAAQAEALNKEVQKIDPRLYLFCNYQPAVIYTFSPDGWFSTAIDDLYNFAVDSGPVLKRFWAYLGNDMTESDFQLLKDSISTIEMLRSVKSHNKSSQNGWLERHHLEQYGQWVANALRFSASSMTKQAPDSPEDYEEMAKELKYLAKDLLAETKRFVDYQQKRTIGVNTKGIPAQQLVAVLQNARMVKENLVRIWVDEILYRYCNNTSREIYRGVLIDAYLARGSLSKPSLAAESAQVLESKVRRWMRVAMEAPLLKAKQDAAKDVQAVQESLDSLEATAQAAGALSPPAGGGSAR